MFVLDLLRLLIHLVPDDRAARSADQRPEDERPSQSSRSRFRSARRQSAPDAAPMTAPFVWLLVEAHPLAEATVASAATRNNERFIMTS